MEIHVLGPVEVSHAGEALRLARRQQRLILGILALEANHLVQRDRLIDLIWGERPPHQARSVLQTRISELRSALNQPSGLRGGAYVSTHDSGYMLQIPPQQVDANRFRENVKQAHLTNSDEEARRLLRQALDLWRGPVLGGNLHEVAHAALCRGLEAARLTAAEDLFDIELRLGNHGLIVDELVGLSGVDQTRERLVGQLILALHRSGRSAEALREYDRWRRWLSDELGVDPGNEVQRLHQAILRGEPVAPVDTGKSTHPGSATKAAEQPHSKPAAHQEAGDLSASAAPRTLPPDVVDFVGRSQEIATLSELLTQRTHSGVTVVAVSGHGGIGKTALSVHIAHRLKNVFPDGQLYANLRGVDEQEAADPFDVIGRFLRTLGVDGAAVPTSVDERADLYRQLLADRHIIVVLDNAASDDQALPLIPGSPTCGVIINARARVGGTLGAHMFQLGALEPEEAVTLLSQIGGTARPATETAAAAELCRRCGYLPLAIRILGAKLTAKPHWSIAKLVDLLHDEHDRLDQLSFGHLDVRASIALSYHSLRPNDQCLLRRLGDSDLHDITTWMATALLDATPAIAEESLERLFDAQLLDLAVRDVTGPTRYRLHDLVRLFARERAHLEEAPQQREAARTRGFGAWLFMTDAAHRTAFGGDYQNIHGDATRWHLDEDLVAELVAEPIRWFETERMSIVAAVQRAVSDGRCDVAWNLACTASPLFEARRFFDEWQTVLNAALAQTERMGDQRGLAAMLYRRGVLRIDQTEYDQAIADFGRAAELFERTGDRHGHATVRTYLALATRVTGNLAEALDICLPAAAALHHFGDRGGEGFALRQLGQIHLERHEYAEAEDYLQRALDLHRTAGAPQATAQSLFWQSMLRLRQGRTDDAETGFAAALDICRALNERPGEAQCLHGLGLCSRQRGDPAAARTALAEALRLVRQAHITLLEAQILRSMAELDCAIEPGVDST